MCRVPRGTWAGFFATGILLLAMTGVPSAWAEHEAPVDSCARRAWRWNPAGRSWCDFYMPHDDSTFMKFGMDLLIRLETPGAVDLYFMTAMRTRAGYHYSDEPTSPRTPVDLLEQAWEQALGGTWYGALATHLYFHRTCVHPLDKATFDPVVWTGVVVGVGPLLPYTTVLTPVSHGHDTDVRWFVGGGPIVRTGQRSTWTINSPITAEGWARADVVRSLGRFGRVDVYGEIAMQRSLIGPCLRHAVRSEIGWTFPLGHAGWRFYVGRWWRDTRLFWSTDQRTHTGLAFIF